MLSKPCRILIKTLKIEKKHRAKKIINEFYREDWSIDSVNNLLCEIDLTNQKSNTNFVTSCDEVYTLHITPIKGGSKMPIHLSVKKILDFC